LPLPTLRLRARLESGEIVSKYARLVSPLRSEHSINCEHLRMSKKEMVNWPNWFETSVKNGKMIICSLRVQSVIFRNSLTKHSIRCEASIIAPPTSLLR
jgi:hypothetical protein